MASIKLSLGAKAQITGPIISRFGDVEKSSLSTGKIVYVVDYNPSYKAWRVSLKKGAPAIALIRRKNLKPVEDSTKFKKGDRVVINSSSLSTELSLQGSYGTIVKVVNTTSFSYRVRFETPTPLYLWFKADELSKVAAKSEDSTSKKESELTIDIEFLKAAHAAACPEWKKKIEKEYPSVFVKEKTWKPMDLGSEITFNEDSQNNIFIGVGFAPKDLMWKCLMMNKSKVIPSITSHDDYYVVTFKTLQD